MSPKLKTLNGNIQSMSEALIPKAIKLKQYVDEASKLEAKESAKDTGVTDHALVRYLERVCGIDTEKLKKHMLTGSRKAAVEMGCERIKCGDYTLICKEGVVVTVLGKDMS